jgi:hypothetical protein
LVDPLGLAYRQKRPLETLGFKHISFGPFHHDRFLFDDGTESGYYDDSRVKDDPASEKLKSRYKNDSEYLQDNILKQAVENIKPKWNRTNDSLVNDYKLTNAWRLSHNCQDYADEVLREYYRLLKEMENANPCK